MVSKNNSQKRVNRKIKLTRRRVSNSSSKKRTNKRSNSTSSSSNKSKKRHFKKRSRKRTTNKTSKKRRKSKNRKNTKVNNVLMKGGRKLYEALILSGTEISDLYLVTLVKELFDNLPEGIIPYHKVKRITTLEYLSRQLLQNQINIPFIDFMISLMTISDPKSVIDAQRNIKQMIVPKEAREMKPGENPVDTAQYDKVQQALVKLKDRIIKALNTTTTTEGLKELKGMINIKSIIAIFSENIKKAYPQDKIPQDRIPEDFKGIKEKIINLVDEIIKIIMSMEDENLKIIMFLYIFGDMLNEAPQGYSDLAKKLRNNMKHIICVLLNKIYQGEGIDFFPLNISILIDKPIVLLMYLLTQKFRYKKNIIELLEKIIKILITENIQTNSEEISNLIH